MTAPVVTVITITRRRTALLPRAIAAVTTQLLQPIEHLIVIDDCAETRSFLQRQAGLLPASLRWQYEPRAAGDVSGPGRSAVIRNRGVRAAAGQWIAFLDDDNEIESGHLAALLDTATRTGTRAVHSWLQMFRRDGSPYLDPADPWRPDPVAARRRFEWAVAHGVRSPGSHVFRDRFDAADVPDPVRTVDTGEWLLRRDLLLELPLVESYPQGGEAMWTEDDAYMRELLRQGEPTACSERPSLRYYLGGYSNTGEFA